MPFKHWNHSPQSRFWWGLRKVRTGFHQRTYQGLRRLVQVTLVGGLEHQFYFPIYWEFHHPNWLSYFSEGWPNHQPEHQESSKRKTHGWSCGCWSGLFHLDMLLPGDSETKAPGDWDMWPPHRPGGKLHHTSGFTPWQRVCEVEQHHFSWVNPLFQWPFSSSQTVSLLEGTVATVPSPLNRIYCWV